MTCVVRVPVCTHPYFLFDLTTADYHLLCLLQTKPRQRHLYPTSSDVLLRRHLSRARLRGRMLYITPAGRAVLDAIGALATGTRPNSAPMGTVVPFPGAHVSG